MQASQGTVRERLESLVDELFDKGIRYQDAVREFERRFITRALADAEGNCSRAAARLGIHRNTLSRKVTELRLTRRSPTPR